jgi:hypothetical protein
MCWGSTVHCDCKATQHGVISDCRCIARWQCWATGSMPKPQEDGTKTSYRRTVLSADWQRCSTEQKVSCCIMCWGSQDGLAAMIVSVSD